MSFRYWKIQETDAQRESANPKRGSATPEGRKASFNSVYCTYVGFIVDNNGTDDYNPEKGEDSVDPVKISSSGTFNGKPNKFTSLQAIFELSAPQKTPATWWATNPSDNKPRYIQYDYGAGKAMRPQRIVLGSAPTSGWKDYAWRKVTILSLIHI